MTNFLSIALVTLTLGSINPTTGNCNIPSKMPVNLPIENNSSPASAPATIPPRQNSLVHMQSFFKNVTKYFGTHYRSGGESPAGFDCSGFVRFMYDKVFNMALPRSSREMSAMGNKVSKEELQPGDLVFFHSKSRRINHVGIFIGNDTFIHSSLSKGITEDQLKYNYYEKRFAGAVRLLDLTTLPLPAQQESIKEMTKPS